MTEQDDVAASLQASGNGSEGGSPSQFLERAAQRLLEMSSDPMGPPPPWWVDWPGGKWGEHREPQICGRGKPLFTATDYATVSDLEWAASMGPAVAAPLVALLRDAARRMEKHSHLDPNGSTYQRCALDLARAILGVGAEGKERSDP